MTATTPPAEEAALACDYDGEPTVYEFGTERSRWKRSALSLSEAIRAFRAGVLFPHDYSDDPDPESKAPTGVKTYAYTASRAGASIPVEVYDKRPANPDAEHYHEQRRPVGRVVVARIAPENPAADAFSVPDAIRGALESHGQAPSTETALSTTHAAQYGARSEMAAQQVKLGRLMQELETKRDELLAQRRDLEAQVAKMKAELDKRMEQIWVIELFLGVQTKVVLVRDGELAPADTPITLAQLVLCMDEEIAIHDWEQDDAPDVINQFSADDIEEFDKWLASSDAALEQLFPYPKGVRALRVRRKEKKREAETALDAIHNAQAAKRDQMVYVLIRNGERVVRLWVDVKIWPRLFPRLDEWDEAMAMAGEGSEWVREGRRERALQAMKRQLAGFILLQGIVENSDLLHPLPAPQLSLFSSSDVDEYFDLVRDDEEGLALADDDPLTSLTWPEYRKWLIAQLQPGVRVMWDGERRYAFYDRKREGTPLGARTGNERLSHWPVTGDVFVLKRRAVATNGWAEFEDEGHVYSFLYLPGDELEEKYWEPNPDRPGWGWWRWRTKARTRRVTFQCYRDELWPIDFMSWRVLEHMMLDRHKRRSYGDFMPLAWHWMRRLRAEAAAERPFVDLVLRQAGGELEDEADRARAERLVRWWKMKTKEHRTVDTDDAKALRMIAAAFRRGRDFDNDPERLLFS